MKAPKAPPETLEQKQSRIRAEQDGIRELQKATQSRTSLFRRLKSPRVSIATGRQMSGVPLV